jgi:proteasome lid subunit RPN8/RPN11
MIEIVKSQLEEIYRHSVESYPNECCGLLVGTVHDRKEVKEVHRGKNLVVERARDRYELDPLDILRVQKGCREKQLEIMGFYHSHPDYPSRPSKFDAERAWPEYSYIIVSVVDGTVRSINSWVFNEELRNFEEETVITKD